MVNDRIYCPECGGLTERRNITFDRHISQKFYCKECDIYFGVSITRTKVQMQEIYNLKIPEM